MPLRWAEACVQLDSADQIETGFARHGGCHRVARECVVVSDGESIQAQRNGKLNQSVWRKAAIGSVSVRVKVDKSPKVRRVFGLGGVELGGSTHLSLTSGKVSNSKSSAPKRASEALGSAHGPVFVDEEDRAVGGFSGLQLHRGEGDGGSGGGGLETRTDAEGHRRLAPLFITVGGAEVEERVDGVFVKQLKLDDVAL